MLGMKTKTIFPKHKNKPKALRQLYSLLDYRIISFLASFIILS